MRYRSHPGQTGYSLVEVLVALLITSVGMLGLAGLQLNSLRNTNSAGQRLEATTLAYDILERMRANRRAATLGAYNIEVGEDSAGAEPAAQDLAVWKSTLAMLPDGDGAVQANAQQVTVTVQWTDAVDDGNNRTARIHLRTEL